MKKLSLLLLALGTSITTQAATLPVKCTVTETKESRKTAEYNIEIQAARSETTVQSKSFPELIISVKNGASIQIRILDQNLVAASGAPEELAQAEGTSKASLELLLNRIERSAEFRSRVAVDCTH